MQDEGKRDRTTTPTELSPPINARKTQRICQELSQYGCVRMRLRTHITVEVSASTPLGVPETYCVGR